MQPREITGVQFELDKSESLQSESIKLYGQNDSPARVKDRIKFLAQTEKAYFDQMYNYIKNDLGCKAMVTGTILFGPIGLYTHSDMDFIDTHAYWQHPRFPNRPWDQADWLISQKAMTEYFADSTFFKLALGHLSNKPVTVTEYNHPAPLDSQAECVPMIASFAAAQDFSGVWLYTYSHSSDDWDRQMMNSFFDIDTNPAKWGFIRSGAAIFRDAAVTPLNASKLMSFSTTGDYLNDLIALHQKDSNKLSAVLLPDPTDLNNKRLYAPSSRDFPIPAVSSQTKISWPADNNQSAYVVTSAGALIAIGRPGRLNQPTYNQIQLHSPAFAAVTITSLDNPAPANLRTSKNILITACGRCENTDMKFSPDRSTVSTNWGRPPVLIETVDATINLPLTNFKCYALNPDGTVKSQVPVSDNTVHITPKYQTMWYLLKKTN